MEGRKKSFRIVEFDCAKGLLIVLMVLGHCLQLWNGKDYLEEGSYYDNVLFKTIYSFHLPMFAIISGYLYYFKHDESLKHKMSKLFFSLFVPILSWSVLFKFYQYIYLNIEGDVTFTVFDILYFIITNLWFLWAILINSLFIIVLQKCKSDNVITSSFLILLILFIPSFLHSHLYFFLTPFFFGGYLINKKNIIKKVEEQNLILMFSSFLMWIGLLSLFSRSTYIYDTKIYLFEWGLIGWKAQLYNDVVRIVIGFVGSLFVFCAIKVICNCVFFQKLVSFFSSLGKVSLGIYIISLQVNMVLLPVVDSLLTKSYLMNVVETIFIVAFCVGMVWIIKRSQVLNFLLLGSRS